MINLIIIFFAFLFTPISKVISIIAPTFLGNDGKLSARKSTAFIFVLLTIWTLYKYFQGVRIEEHIWFGLLGMVLLLFGIITWQQVESFRNGK